VADESLDKLLLRALDQRKFVVPKRVDKKRYLTSEGSLATSVAKIQTWDDDHGTRKGDLRDRCRRDCTATHQHPQRCKQETKLIPPVRTKNLHGRNYKGIWRMQAGTQTELSSKREFWWNKNYGGDTDIWG
jgi:hypothetical protein